MLNIYKILKSFKIFYRLNVLKLKIAHLGIGNAKSF